MKIQQLSVFIENRSGRLAGITRCLGEAQVNIRAMSLADTSDFGILRLIVDQADKAQTLLQKAGFMVSRAEVIAVEIEDRPGELGRLLTAIERAGLNVEYMYAFVQKNMDRAVIMFRFDDLDKAIETIQPHGFNVIASHQLLQM